MNLMKALADEQKDKFNAIPDESYTLAAPYFYDPVLYEREKERLFARNWRFVGHQSELATAGDYLTLDLAGEKILVMRGQDGTIRAFYNVCRHRAAELVKGRGNLKAVVTCPYHSWAYDLEGNLRSAHNCENVKGFRKEDFSLKSVQVEVFCGFVFVNLDPKAVSLKSQIAEMEPLIRRECPNVDAFKLASRQEYLVKANWKAIVDNFIESYHLALSGPAHKAFTDLVDCNKSTFKVMTHNIWSSHIGPSGPKHNTAYDYEKPRDIGGSNQFVSIHLFPDIGLLFFPGASAVVSFIMSPAGPETTQQIFSYYTPDGAADEATKKGIDYFSYVLGPEDNELCEGVQRGLRSRAYYQGRLMVDAEHSGISEHAVHHFHAQVMKAMGD